MTQTLLVTEIRRAYLDSWFGEFQTTQIVGAAPCQQQGVSRVVLSGQVVRQRTIYSKVIYTKFLVWTIVPPLAVLWGGTSVRLWAEKWFSCKCHHPTLLVVLRGYPTSEPENISAHISAQQNTSSRFQHTPKLNQLYTQSSKMMSMKNQRSAVRSARRATVALLFVGKFTTLVVLWKRE